MNEKKASAAKVLFIFEAILFLFSIAAYVGACLGIEGYLAKMMVAAIGFVFIILVIGLIFLAMFISERKNISFRDRKYYILNFLIQAFNFGQFIIYAGQM